MSKGDHQATRTQTERLTGMGKGSTGDALPIFVKGIASRLVLTVPKGEKKGPPPAQSRLLGPAKAGLFL